MNKYCASFLAFLVILHHASAQDTLSLSTICTGLPSCSVSLLTLLLPSGSSLSVDTSLTVDASISLSSVTTTASGAVSVAQGQVLTVENALTVASSTSVSVAGVLFVQGSTAVSGSIVVASGAAVTFVGDVFTASAAVVSIQGSLVAQASVTVSGSLFVGDTSNSATASFAAGLSLQAASNLWVYGTATINAVSGATTDALLLASTSSVYVASTATLTVNSDVNNAQGNVTVVGQFIVNSGSAVGAYAQTQGYLILQDSTVAQTSTGITANVTISGSSSSSYGVLSGTGNINGDLNVGAHGVVSPGNSPGTSFVNGDVRFSSSGTYQFEVDNNAGTHDLIVASGTAYLNGLVHCTFTNTAVSGAKTYSALTYNARSGTFTSLYGDYGHVTSWTEIDSSDGKITSFNYSGSSTIAASVLVILAGLFASML